MNIMICGPGECGKDTVCNWLSKNIRLELELTCSTSWIIYQEILKRYPEQTFEDRKRFRELWYEIGRELCANDPAFLVKECIKNSLSNRIILQGIRAKEELEGCKKENLIDLYIWIERNVKHDPTMKFGPEDCDIIIQNNSTLEDLYTKLERFSKFLEIK